MGRTPVLLLELNEVSFELISRYVATGRLPTFARLLERHGVAQTHSESRYEELEPWIQWVTAHTGLTYAEHGVFRLGDIAATDHDQIWERLERQGLKVGAVSPMNAKHRLESPAFFLPDPWTDTRVTATPLVRRLHAAICQAVNDNASSKITPVSLLWLVAGAARYASPSNYAEYLGLAMRAVRRHWSKAAFLDLLIADLSCALVARYKVDFASVFLNAAAHVQHHYMHSSSVVQSTRENPEWYCPDGEDPLLEIYQTYDRIIAQFERRFRGYRLMIATGLHQVPHNEPVYYWRLHDHAAFVKQLGVFPVAIQPRMSRDFILEFAHPTAAVDAANQLRQVRDLEGQPLLEIDNRGRDLFVTFAYSRDIPPDFVYVAGNRSFLGLREEVAFVAIKNGHHDGTGFFLDTGGTPHQSSFMLAELPGIVETALRVRIDAWEAGAP